MVSLAARWSSSCTNFPTVDHEPVPADVKETVRELLEKSLAQGHTVLVGCSSAQGRTMEVLRSCPWAQ